MLYTCTEILQAVLWSLDESPGGGMWVYGLDWASPG